ncbi:MAG: 4Fe-4S dicluster domain-containing protein, partial [Burkholderiales bacterium]|nr:4Fe-4S dicluster domain-containing protein [Burkholderiales bacterium]
METHLADWLKGTPDGIEAESILRSCVHCGFCTATCPTYQLLGDELDGPRGRIYLIKQVIEGKAPTAAWRCEVVSASANTKAECRISVVTPKSGGAVLTVAIEPRW